MEPPPSPAPLPGRSQHNQHSARGRHASHLQRGGVGHGVHALREEEGRDGHRRHLSHNTPKHSAVSPCNAVGRERWLALGHAVILAQRSAAVLRTHWVLPQQRKHGSSNRLPAGGVECTRWWTWLATDDWGRCAWVASQRERASSASAAVPARRSSCTVRATACAVTESRGMCTNSVGGNRVAPSANGPCRSASARPMICTACACVDGGGEVCSSGERPNCEV